MLTDNYKKIAIIDNEQTIRTKKEYNWEDVTLPMNLSFTPSRILVGITVYHTGGSSENPNGTHFVDSKYNNSEGYYSEIRGSSVYIKTFDKNNFTMCIRKTTNQTMRGLHIIAIE